MLKLIRYHKEERESYGVLIDSKVVCLPRLAKSLNGQLPELLKEFIALGAKSVETAERLLKRAPEDEIQLASSPIKELTLLAPVASPPKILCLGLNYRDHISEQNATIPDEPIIFIKPHTTIIGPNENIVKPSFVNKLDYEAELAIVMGKKAKNVLVSEAESYILGYTILNDVSARDFQFKDKQWTRGKSFDTFAPTGPCLTAVSQLQDTSDLFIRTWVNNELRQNSTTKNMVFNPFQIIHHISKVMTLEPCDVIATGTPAGVAFAMKPRPKFLQAGDAVKIEIEKIGVLENLVVKDTAS